MRAGNNFAMIANITHMATLLQHKNYRIWCNDDISVARVNRYIKENFKKWKPKNNKIFKYHNCNLRVIVPQKKSRTYEALIIDD